MVVAVGRPRLKRYIIGLVAVALSFGFTLYLYSYFLSLAYNNADIIVKPSEIPRLILFIVFALILGIFGGIEIGRFMGSANNKNSDLKNRT